MTEPTVRQAMRISSETADFGGVGDEPGDLVVEVPGVTRAVAGPGHLGDGRAVGRAVHPRRVGLEEALHGPEVERPPPSTALALVITRSTDPAPSTTTLCRSPRSHEDDDRVLLFIGLNVFDHRRLVDTDASAATLGTEQRRSPRLVFGTCVSPKT